MNYSLTQRPRAAIDFASDISRLNRALEQQADAFAEAQGLTEQPLADDLNELQQQVTPKLQQSVHFRMHRLLREWILEQHGNIAIDAFEEVREQLQPTLDALKTGPTQITYNPNLQAPDYWQDKNFHRTHGNWDNHDYMGFIHGELIHRRMVNDAFAGMVLKIREATAQLLDADQINTVLELGCGSAQYTMGLARTFPDAELWACDISARQLEQAQRTANENNYHWHLFQAKAEDTGLESASFDVVTSFAMFHELPTAIAKQVIAEAYRLLKPGGMILIADVKAYHVLSDYERWRADFWNQIRGGDRFWRTYATNDLSVIASDTGFKQASWQGANDSQYPFVLKAIK